MKRCYKISKENLRVNGYKSEIIKSDFHELTKIAGKFDGIVTDLPYGEPQKHQKILKRS